jgi:hypothetical protein
MLCKIWGFHGGDYEECPLLGYNSLGRTSQETYYVSATESSWLMICKIWSFHGCDYKERYILLTLILARRFFAPEDGGDRFFGNVSCNKTHTPPHRLNKSMFCTWTQDMNVATICLLLQPTCCELLAPTRSCECREYLASFLRAAYLQGTLSRWT